MYQKVKILISTKNHHKGFTETLQKKFLDLMYRTATNSRNNNVNDYSRIVQFFFELTPTDNKLIEMIVRKRKQFLTTIMNVDSASFK